MINAVFVGWQDPQTREWIPVARLRRDAGRYLLNYTNGAHRASGFTGFARMADLGATYISDELFPFFTNRLLSRARSDYLQYSRWLGLHEDVDYDPLHVLALTGGARATDSFEIIPAPSRSEGRLKMNFFVRGLKYAPKILLEYFNSLESGTKLYIVRDVQNEVDSSALVVRTEKPAVLMGYVPRYYSVGLSRLLESTHDVSMYVERVNPDAPFDLRMLCSIDALWPESFKLLESNRDFLRWTEQGAV